MIQENLNNIPPMNIMEFSHLFVYIEETLAKRKCTGSLYLTKLWIGVNAPDKAETILSWLAEHGICCDCEMEKKVLPYF